MTEVRKFKSSTDLCKIYFYPKRPNKKYSPTFLQAFFARALTKSKDLNHISTCLCHSKMIDVLTLSNSGIFSLVLVMIIRNILEQTFSALYKEPTGRNTVHVIYWYKAYISDCHSVSRLIYLSFGKTLGLDLKGRWYQWMSVPHSEVQRARDFMED